MSSEVVFGSFFCLYDCTVTEIKYKDIINDEGCMMFLIPRTITRILFKYMQIYTIYIDLYRGDSKPEIKDE